MKTKNPAASKLTFEPTGDNILVERLTLTKEKTEGGIVIPEQVRDQMQAPLSRVLAVGPGHRREDGTHVKPLVKPGMTVVLREEPQVIPNEADDQWLGLCSVHAVSAIARGPGLKDYERSTTYSDVARSVDADLQRQESKAAQAHLAEGVH